MENRDESGGTVETPQWVQRTHEYGYLTSEGLLPDVRLHLRWDDDMQAHPPPGHKLHRWDCEIAGKEYILNARSFIAACRKAYALLRSKVLADLNAARVPSDTEKS